MMHLSKARRAFQRRALIGVALTVGCGSSARLPIAAVSGPSPAIPAPTKSTIPTVNPAKVVGWSGNSHPVAVPGTTVSAFARRLDHPRWLYVLPNGDVLVAESNAPPRPDMRRGVRRWFLKMFMREQGADDKSANRITLLRDADGDGIAEVKSTFIGNLNSPFGMALVGNMLYVANTDAIVRFPYTTDQLQVTSSPTKIANLPAGTINHHWTRGLIASRDGRKLYVSVGSNSDWGERGMDVETERAAILEVDIATGNRRIYASGLRNPVGLEWVPETGALWTAVNEREELGGDTPPDYMTAVRDGGFYGWPYSYHGANVDSRVEPQRPDLVMKAIVPDYALGAHTSSMGLAYARGTSLPARFNNGMIVTQHGSWNRIPHSGYRVVFVPFTNGRPSGQPTVLLSGFLNDDGEAYGRPVGVAIDKRGGVLIADDAGNTIWRVSGTQPIVASSTPAGTTRAQTMSAMERHASLIADAEARGAAHPREANRSAAPRRCVDANINPNSASGEFTVAGFPLYPSTWQQKQGRLVLKPLIAERGAPLVVRARELGSGQTAEYRVNALSGSIGDNASYSLAMQLPAKGQWLLVAEAGKSFGCFVYSF